MGYDPQRKIFTPDFQAPQLNQQWVPMGDDESGQDAGAIGSAFKQRFMDGGGAPKGDLPMVGAEGKAGMEIPSTTGKAGAGGGGMFKSLG